MVCDFMVPAKIMSMITAIIQKNTEEFHVDIQEKQQSTIEIQEKA